MLTLRKKDAMFQPDRYSFIPPLKKRHIPIVVAWVVVIVIIALISSRGVSARYAPIGLHF